MSLMTKIILSKGVLYSEHISEGKKILQEITQNEIFNEDIFLKYINEKADPNVEKYWRLEHRKPKGSKKFRLCIFKGNIEWAILKSKEIVWPLVNVSLIVSKTIGNFFQTRRKIYTLKTLREYLIQQVIEQMKHNDLLWIQRTKKYSWEWTHYRPDYSVSALTTMNCDTLQSHEWEL